jgi:hypothetical protein
VVAYALGVDDELTYGGSFSCVHIYVYMRMYRLLHQLKEKRFGGNGSGNSTCACGMLSVE